VAYFFNSALALWQVSPLWSKCALPFQELTVLTFRFVLVQLATATECRTAVTSTPNCTEQPGMAATAQTAEITPMALVVSVARPITTGTQRPTDALRVTAVQSVSC